MKSQLKQLMIIASIFLIVFTGIVIVNQTAQAVSLATTINPLLGRAVLCFLLVFYAVALIVPFLIFLRLPKPLTPPEDESSKDFQTYIARFGARLQKNSNLAGRIGRLTTLDEIHVALKLLDDQSSAIIKSRATTVFLSTAISQNGRLDAITVLMTQTRMVWQIAHLYNQRPTLRDMIHLYSNVGTAVLLASEIQNIDISEQLEPTIRTIFGTALLTVVPGASALSSMVIHSILEGTSNAYLTLRVGVICQRYCNSVSSSNQIKLVKSASVAAAGMLGAIVTSSGAAIVQSITSVAKKAGTSAVESAAIRVREVGSKLNPFTSA